MREVYAAAFASGLTKLYSVIFSDNSAVIHLAHQLGAKREGKLRQHTLRGGKPADMLVLGLTREDFAKCLPT
jgi:RimJ/RimL family protein N-acetyltransferase